jgi:hypothetical protein
MLNSPVKRFILPFSAEKSNEILASEVEAAVVYALSEFERMKGGGLILKQPEETLHFIAEMGYPLWLFPNNLVAYIFDGLNDFQYSFPYVELPAAKSFMENLEANSKTREDYMTFLSDNSRYFLQPTKEKEFSIRSLIVDSDFKTEFGAYRKEATEVMGQVTKLVALTPILQETIISSIIAEMNRLQSSLKENADELPECLRCINKTTDQYITELNYAAEAVKDETDAKIKAQEELINPQIIKLNSEYKRQIAKVTVSFDEELVKLERRTAKTSKSIDNEEKNLKLYERAAERHAKKNHLIYEKRWKSKSRQAKKEIDGLEKELKRIENNIKYLSKQKNEKISALRFALESEIKLARQPLLDFETARDAKILIFKQETEKLVNQEKPLVESLKDAIELAERVSADFQTIGIRNLQLRDPALFYVPFYVVCYQGGTANRYLFLAPSVTRSVGFAAKLKGVIGISKVKEIFTPRFRAIAVLIDRIQDLVKQDSLLDQQINELGERNNLLKNELTRVNIAKGLVYLKDAGWLSQREYQLLTNSLTKSC